MTKFKCYFPGCNYETDSRSKIDFHHIIPQEIKKSKVTIPLCKTHHALIYVPEATAGQHSINTSDSLIVKGKYKSTDIKAGDAILYEDINGNSFYWYPETKEKWNS